MDLPSEVQAALASDDGGQLQALLLEAPPEAQASLAATALRAACILGCTQCALAALAQAPEPGQEVLRPDHQSFTSLHHAAREGQADTLRALLKLMDDGSCLGQVDACTQDVRVSRLSHLCGGVTPLHLASASCDAESVSLLLDARADPAAQDWNGWSAADHCRGNARVLALLGCQALASGLSPAEYEETVRRRNEERVAAVTPESFAVLAAKAEDGDADEFLALLRASNAKHLLGELPIIQAVVAIDCPQSLRILLEVLRCQGKPGHDPENAEPVPGLNALDAMGFAPLHCAVETGAADCIQPLLEARADVAVRTKDASFKFGQTTTVYTEGGLTALHLAAQKLSVDAVRALLAGGAPEAEQSSFGQTAHDLAAEALAIAPAPSARAREAAGALSVDADHLPDPATVRAQHSVRQTAVRERYEEAENPMKVRARDLLRIIGTYKPLDESVAFGTIAADALQLGSAMPAPGRALAEVLSAFKQHDYENDGFIAQEEMARLLHLLDPGTWSPGRVAKLLEGAEVTADGRINYSAFLNWAGEDALLPGPDAPMAPPSGLRSPGTAGVQEPVPGVYVFRFLPEPICGKLWDETEHYLAQAESGLLPLPLRHDGCLDLSHVFPGLLGLFAEAAMPAIRTLLTPDLHGVSLRHAFRTKNFVGRDENFKRHVDKYAVTLNVCLRCTADVQGSGVFFFDDDTTEDVAYLHHHEVGLAVLHSSKNWHQTEPLRAGERGSLIMWFAHDPVLA